MAGSEDGIHVKSIYSEESTKYDDDDKYEFLDGGILAIHEEKRQLTEYSPPGIWQGVQADASHKPGKTKREPGEGRRAAFVSG